MGRSPFAAAAAGIDDEILAIGEFQALGASKNMVEGATAGGFIGSLIPGGREVGDIVGLVAGQQAGARFETRDADGVYRWLLAVSPTKVYVLVPSDTEDGLRGQAKDLLDGAVTLHCAVRTLTIEDHATGDKLELEGIRHGKYHATDVIHALTAHDDEAAAV